MSASVLALIAALAAPIGAYLVAARRFSGKIKTSEAEELWAEARSIRQDSARRLETLNAVVERLEARVGSLEAENAGLRRRVTELTSGRANA